MIAIPVLLDFLAKRGCHGVLMLGTTGEGPSFSPQERHDILSAALKIRQDHPSLKVLVGTGTPSLSETILITKSAFDLGVDGVVVLPPYYYRRATDEGLFNYFGELDPKRHAARWLPAWISHPRADRYWFHARSSQAIKGCLPAAIYWDQGFFTRCRSCPPAGQVLWIRSAGNERYRFLPSTGTGKSSWWLHHGTGKPVLPGTTAALGCFPQRR